MSYYSPLNEDAELGYGGKPFKEPTYEFAERNVRQGFVRKVFGLLAMQLALTAGVTAAIIYSAPVKQYMAANAWTLWTPVGLSLVLILVLAFSEQARRSHPYNLILLFAFTACESVLVGAASASYNTEVVLIAVGITAVVVSSLVLFSLQTRYDVTGMGGILFALLTTLIVASVVQMFVRAPALHIAICAGGALLFSVYLIFDVQLLMGNQSVAISTDEYVLVALNIYLDVINLFLYILQIVQEMTRNN